MTQHDQISAFIDNELTHDAEQDFLISLASNDGVRKAFRSELVLKNVIHQDEMLTVPNREVRWHVVEAFIDYSRLQRRDEWVGTDIVFQLTPQDSGNKTQLDFEHIGLTPAFECFEVCNAGWSQFLGSLQSLVETGQGQPFVAAEPATHA